VLLQVTFPIYVSLPTLEFTKYILFFLLSLLGNNSRYALVANFNAKTSDLPDFCGPDENFLDIINLSYDEEILKYFYDHNNLVENGVSLYRYTQHFSIKIANQSISTVIS
jgi:hypothetical protein